MPPGAQLAGRRGRVQPTKTSWRQDNNRHLAYRDKTIYHFRAPGKCTANTAVEPLAQKAHRWQHRLRARPNRPGTKMQRMLLGRLLAALGAGLLLIAVSVYLVHLGELGGLWNARHQLPFSPSSSSSQATTNAPQLLVPLNSEAHRSRPNTTIYLDWTITKGFRFPDGVQKCVYLVNGERVPRMRPLNLHLHFLPHLPASVLVWACAGPPIANLQGCRPVPWPQRGSKVGRQSSH